MSCCGKNIIQTVAHGTIGLTKVALRIGIADKETIQKRRDCCRWCEYATKNNNSKYDEYNGLTSRSMCQKCHCLISAKTQLLKERCPQFLW